MGGRGEGRRVDPVCRGRVGIFRVNAPRSDYLFITTLLKASQEPNIREVLPDVSRNVAPPEVEMHLPARPILLYPESPEKLAASTQRTTTC